VGNQENLGSTITITVTLQLVQLPGGRRSICGWLKPATHIISLATFTLLDPNFKRWEDVKAPCSTVIYYKVSKWLQLQRVACTSCST